jgi:AraC family transcriptional regulator
MRYSNKDLIIKSIEIIEDKLRDNLSVNELASEVGISLYHFIRLFQNATGFSPKSYIIKRILTESLKEIKKGNKRISEIAYDYNFGSPESFTRAFKKMYGYSPTKIKSETNLIVENGIEKISRDYILQSDVTKHREPELIEQDTINIIGISFFIEDGVEVKDLSKQWNEFIVEISPYKHLIGNKYIQAQLWSDKNDIGGIYFFIGVDLLDTQYEFPAYFNFKKIPKGKYLKFIHKGFSNKVIYTYKYIYKDYLLKSNYRPNKAFNYEIYGDHYKGPFNENSESEIYIPVE